MWSILCDARTDRILLYCRTHGRRRQSQAPSAFRRPEYALALFCTRPRPFDGWDPRPACKTNESQRGGGAAQTGRQGWKRDVFAPVIERTPPACLVRACNTQRCARSFRRFTFSIPAYAANGRAPCLNCILLVCVRPFVRSIDATKQNAAGVKRSVVTCEETLVHKDPGLGVKPPMIASRSVHIPRCICGVASRLPSHWQQTSAETRRGAARQQQTPAAAACALRTTRSMHSLGARRQLSVPLTPPPSIPLLPPPHPHAHNTTHAAAASSRLRRRGHRRRRCCCGAQRRQRQRRRQPQRSGGDARGRLSPPPAPAAAAAAPPRRCATLTVAMAAATPTQSQRCGAEGGGGRLCNARIASAA